MQLIVLGMHRSGTSVLARVLNLMGAYFGPEGKSTGANAENPTGFWERKDVRSLNDALLHAADCDWNRVLEFDIAKLPHCALEDFHRHASRLVLEIDAHRPWFLKEPRLCLLFSLWRRYIDLPVCIHVLRHPLEVAASLGIRNAMPIDAGLVLWEHYVRSAFAASAGDPSAVVSHRALMEYPGATVQALFEDLGRLGVHGLRMPSEREIRALITTDLYHHRESDQALRTYGDHAQVALFRRLESEGLATPLSAIEPGDPAALAAYEAMLPPLCPPPRAMPSVADEASVTLVTHGQQIKPSTDIVPVETDENSASDELAKVELRLAAHMGTLEKTKIERVRAEEIAEARLVDLSRLTRVLLQHDVQAARLAASNERLAERLLATKARLTTVRADRAQLKEILRTTKRELKANKRESHKNLLKADKHLASSHAEQSMLKTSLQSAVQASTDDRLEIARMHAEASDLRKTKRMLGKQVKTLSAGRARLQVSSEQALRDAALVLRYAQVEHGSALRELDAIRRSLTWRLGAPLRAIAKWVRRVLRRNAGNSTERALREAFDSDWYLGTYPDVATSGADPLTHYLAFGWKEGRNPSATFDTRSYLIRNEDVAKAGMNPLLHYVTSGRTEGRGAC